MDDYNLLEKLIEKLIEKGYNVSTVTIDKTGKAVICFTFAGMGDPFEGQIYFMITEYNGVRHQIQRRGFKPSTHAGLGQRQCEKCQTPNTTDTTRPSRT